jgi:nitrilase
VTSFERVNVAAVQATPVILDPEASIEKAGALLRECAAKGVQLAVLPEAFVSVFPSNSWARGASDFAGWDELWERFW